MTSRRKFLKSAGGVAALAAGPTGAVLSAQTPPTIPDDVTIALVNGKIHTMDDRNTVAATTTIRNGRFITVGGRAPKKAANVRVIDLHGRTRPIGLARSNRVRGTETILFEYDSAWFEDPDRMPSAVRRFS